MKHKELTAKIIECAYKVYNTLGFGFLESVYKKGMVVELTKNSLKVEEETPLKVYYDAKSVENLTKAHACPVQFTSVTAQRI